MARSNVRSGSKAVIQWWPPGSVRYRPEADIAPAEQAAQTAPIAARSLVMNHYAIPYDPNTLATLEYLSAGVIAIGFAKDFPHFKSCTSCFLQTSDGRWIEVAANGEDLEFKFEVFTLVARVVPAPHMVEQQTIFLSNPISVAPLETESWLDPAAPIDHPTYGSDPVMQFVGQPGSAPGTASATCRYLGGVELIGANGTALVIATASFPYHMHVSGYYEDQFFHRVAYRRIGR